MRCNSTGTSTTTLAQDVDTEDTIIQLVEILAVCQSEEQLSPLVDIKIIHITTGGRQNNSLKQSGEFHLLAHPNVGRQSLSITNIYTKLFTSFWRFCGMMKLEILAATALVSTLCLAARLKLKTSCQTAVRNPGMCWVWFDKGEPWWCSLSGADLRDANLKDANLTAANLEGADLTGANLKGPIWRKSLRVILAWMIPI